MEPDRLGLLVRFQCETEETNERGRDSAVSPLILLRVMPLGSMARRIDDEAEPSFFFFVLIAGRSGRTSVGINWQRKEAGLGLCPSSSSTGFLLTRVRTSSSLLGSAGTEVTGVD